MISFDFSSKIDSFINKTDERILNDKKRIIEEKFSNSDMTGWTKRIDSNLVEEMKKLSLEVKSHSSCLVVIGIGGSFLGSCAVGEMFSSYFNDDSFPIIYAGNSLSSKYLSELRNYLKKIDFSVNVISKSGSTREVGVAYHIIKELMDEKYSAEEVKKRIIITTEDNDGILNKEVLSNGYRHFYMPKDVGGRYSIMTAAHLFPLAFNINIDKFIEGYYQGKKYNDDAFSYAVMRKLLFDRGKYVENYCVNLPKMYYFTEWLKQLFAESEGKDGKGILPISMIYTRDLHSLGQFVQEGNKILFETFIKVLESKKLLYKDMELHNINNIVFDSVRDAHYMGDVPCNEIVIDSINEKTIGELMYFFMMSAAYSSFLFGVNPFNQPGVEVYKSEVSKNLDI